MKLRKYSVIGLATIVLASSAMAVATNTFQIGGQGADNGWDDNIVTNAMGSTTNYSITFGTPARYSESGMSNLTFTVTFYETNGIPVGGGQNWLYPTIDDGVEDRRLNSNEVIRFTVTYSDPSGTLTSLRLAGIAPYWNTNPWETTVFTDGVISTNITDSANEIIFDYEGLGLDPLSTNNVATWELLVAVDDALGGGTNFTESGMGAFVLEYVADVDEIPDYVNLTPVFFDFVNSSIEFDNASVGATMTRSNSWDSPVTITTVDIIGQDGTHATGTNNVADNKTNIQSVNALGINSQNNGPYGNESRDFNPNEGWVITFDVDVYLEEIDLASVAADTEMTISSAAFPSNFVMYGQGDDNTGGTWDLLNMFVGAGTNVTLQMTSTTNASDVSLRIDDLTVQVVSDPETYYAWIQDEGLVSQLNDAYGDDPDADTVDNLTEFALGGDPLTDDATALLPVYGQSADGGTNYLNYIYRRRIAYEYAGLTYLVGSTTDLLVSPATNPTEEAGSAAINADIESVTNRVSTDVESEQFMQLKVTID